MKRLAKVVPMSGLALVLCCLFMAGRAPVAQAYSTGITGCTDKGNNTYTCTNCHGLSSATTVAISGPTSLLAGVTGTYTISISNASAGTGKRVGMDVAVNNTEAGALAAGNGEPEVVSNSEVIHSTSAGTLKTSVSGAASYQFKYTMPAAAAIGSNHTIYGTSAIASYGSFCAWGFAPDFTVTTAAPPPGSAGIYYVNAGTGSDMNAGTQGAPFKSITKAMTAAAANSIIYVTPNTYSNPYESFPITMKSGVELIGTGGAATTIIDGNYSSRVLLCNGNNAATLIQGFTIQHGSFTSTTDAKGAGIQCTNNDQTVISSNIITANTISGNDGVGAFGPGATSYGGGVYIANSSTTLINNVISNNAALGGLGYSYFNTASPGPGGQAFGGGLYVVGSGAVILNNTFDNNSAQGGGGGYGTNSSANPVAGGAASAGGAYLDTSAATNNIFSNNLSQGGANSNNSNYQVSTYGGIYGTGTIDHNLFFNNTVNYYPTNAVSDGTTGTHAITGANPQYKDSSNSDYHLNPSSPAVGAGTAIGAPAVDLEDHMRGNPPAVGAYDPVVPTLTIGFNPATVVEGAATTGTVFRNTTTAAALTVTLTSSDTSAATVPTTVIIPAGAASATFTAQGVTDSLADGTQTATLTASTGGFSPGSILITVTDAQTPTLTLSLATTPATNPVSFSEDAGPNAAVGTVARNTPTTTAQVVNLTSDTPGKATVPATVTIPAGSATATFPIAAVNNAIVDGSQTVTITASQSGFSTSAATAIVMDDDSPTLTVSINPNSFSEGAGANAATGTVTRNTLTTSALTVNLTSDTPGKATVPATVTIPVGATSTTFVLGAVDNGIVDSDQTISITASAPGFSAGSAAIVVTNSDGSTLALSISPATFSESAGATAATGTITRNTATASVLTVTLNSSNPAKATVPATIDIPTGATSVNFPISAVDNAIADGPQTATITASAAGFGSGVALVNVTDDDTPALGLSLSPIIFSEGAGANVAVGTITRNTPLAAAQVVNLTSDTPARATVPATVTIPAGATTANFTIRAIDNAIADGTQTVNITVSAPGLISSTALVTVLDNDVARLTLTVKAGTFSETAGAKAATGTVTRNTPLNVPLVVALSSSDKTEATVPTTITIPAGAASATFTIAAVTDTLLDGSQAVVLSATAAGLLPGQAALTVTDHAPNTLNLSLSTSIFSETAGATAAFATITRTGAKTMPLIVTLVSNSVSVKVPPTITIPAGASSAIFKLAAIDNTVADGTRNVIITASAPGFPVSKAGVTVTDNETPTLTLGISPNTFSEGAGAKVVQGIVARNTPPTAALVVTLKLSNATAATWPATVTIPAGATAVTFAIIPINDTVVNGPRVLTFTASAPNYVPAITTATITDDEGPTLAVSVKTPTFSEGAGATASQATVTRTGDASAPVVVTLASSDTTKAKVPTTVTIAAGATSATFNIAAVNNTIVDGSKSVTITASAPGYNTGAAAVTVTDDDGRLTLAVTPGTFSEGAGAKAAVGTVTRNTSTTSSLLVTLKSSDTTEATVPAMVTIPAGAISVTFPVAAIDDKIVDGSQSVTLTASAVGLAAATAKITVTDNDHPLPVAHAATPATSSVKLSTSTAEVATDSVTLKFTGTLDAEIASDPAHYKVEVNAQPIAVESAAYNAKTHSVSLALSPGTSQPGAPVVVSWNGLTDATGLALKDGTSAP